MKTTGPGADERPGDSAAPPPEPATSVPADPVPAFPSDSPVSGFAEPLEPAAPHPPFAAHNQAFPESPGPSVTLLEAEHPAEVPLETAPEAVGAAVAGTEAVPAGYASLSDAAPQVTPFPPTGEESAEPEEVPGQEPEAYPSYSYEGTESPQGSGHANWMLAFVCAWAGVSSLNEARVLVQARGLAPDLLRGPTFLGYACLGIGLLLFAVEALQWGRRRPRGWLLYLVIAAVLFTVAGLAGLLLSKDPGRRI